MFLNHLSANEKKAFLTLAKEFILVDGELSPEEVDFIKIMQALGYANMEYHIQEKAFIKEMADSFGITESELDMVDDWVVRQVALLYEANEFWESEPSKVSA
jgi:uncharacterized tellurite resistance protein B-like protein